MAENDEILVFGRDYPDDRGLEKLLDYFYQRNPVKVATLKDRLRHFLSAMQEVVSDTPNEFGQFGLESITISAEVSAKGQVGLLGTGGEASGKGGITFTLKRMSPQKPTKAAP